MSPVDGRWGEGAGVASAGASLAGSSAAGAASAAGFSGVRLPTTSLSIVLEGCVVSDFRLHHVGLPLA